MAQIAGEEKMFCHFGMLKSDLRMMVIDQMRAGERCRFAQVSKFCNKEAKSSKNYVQELSFSYYSKDYIIINVIHTDQDRYGDIQRGYRLIFSKEYGCSKKKYQSIDFRRTWSTELEESVKLYEYAMKEFGNLLKSHQHAVRKLTLSDASIAIQGEDFRSFKFEIENLKNLEDLTLSGDFDSSQFLSKLRRPLKNLWITDSNEDDHEQIYQVSNKLQWSKSDLTNQQFSQISAKNVVLCMGTLTEKNILNFIRSWQNGTVGKDINIYQWNLNNSEFDEQKFFKLLRANGHDFRTGGFEIKHFKEPERSALLYFERECVKFETNLEK